VAPKAFVAVGLPFGEGRVGEERGRHWLEREADPEFLHHVGLARIVEVGLDGAGAQHHVEPEIADLGHVIEHDRVAALGHDGQVGARFVRPHSRAEKSEPEPVADHLALSEVARGFRAGLVQVLERRSAELELAGWLEADRPVGPAERDHIAVLEHRLPSELHQAIEKVADSAGLVVGRRSVVAATIDELLMLGADAPVAGLLLAALEHGNEVGPSVNLRAGAVVGPGGHGWGRLPVRIEPRQPFRLMARAAGLIASRRQGS